MWICNDPDTWDTDSIFPPRNAKWVIHHRFLLSGIPSHPYNFLHILKSFFFKLFTDRLLCIKRQYARRGNPAWAKVHLSWLLISQFVSAMAVLWRHKFLKSCSKFVLDIRLMGWSWKAGSVFTPVDFYQICLYGYMITVLRNASQQLHQLNNVLQCPLIKVFGWNDEHFLLQSSSAQLSAWAYHMHIIKISLKKFC